LFPPNLSITVDGMLQMLVVPGLDEHQRRLGNFLDSQVGRNMRRQGSNADIFHFLAHPLDGYSRITGVKLDLHLGIFPAKFTQQVIKETVTGSYRAENTDFTRQVPLLPSQLHTQGLPLVKGLLRILPELLTGWCDPYTAIIPFKEGLPNPFLQTLNYAGQTGWTDMAGFTGSTEVQGA